MSVSTRDHLVEIFAYTPTVTAGRTNDAYTKVSERWGGLEVLAGTKTYLNGKEQQRIDAECAFGDDATDVSVNGLLRVKGETQIWKVLAFKGPRRRLREIHVILAAASDQKYPGV